MSKKGQVTIFIIAGILILIAAVIFFAIRAERAERAAEEAVITSERVPIEFDPVKVFVENCLKEVAVEGLKVLGERGGYIEPAEHGISYSTDVTEGGAIRFAGNWVVPYWWHMSAANTCTGDCKFTVIPESRLYLHKSSGSPSMESELENYVNQHLNDCINDFEILEGQGFEIEELEQPRTTVTISDGAVYFGLEYPIEASKIMKKTISYYTATVDVDLKAIYDFAVLLTNLEAAYHYLEMYMLDIIAASSGVDSGKLPPMSDLQFRFGSFVSWSKSQVHEQLASLLPSYIPLLKVWNTLNYEAYEFPDDAFRTAFYQGGMVLPGDIAYNELAVEFDNLGWKPYFDLNCKGDECAPDSISTELMGMFGIQQYYFLYDLSFPALVTIRDPDARAFGNRGYVFNFLLEANIRDNKPMKTNYTQIKVEDASESSMLCDESKRLSGEITVSAGNAVTGESMEGVQVVYSCAGESCRIGETDAQGKLAARFPICLNGIVSFIKDGHATYSEILTTAEDRREALSTKLNPALTKKFTVRKALMQKTAEGFVPVDSTIAAPVELAEGERAVVSLKRKTGVNEMPYSVYAEFAGGSDYAEISIIPGDYEMKVDLYYYNGFEIPERTETVKDEEITYPAVAFGADSPFLNGGLHCSSTGNAFFATNSAFVDADAIVFKALSPDIPGMEPSYRMIEDLEEINKLDDEQYTKHCFVLAPENVRQ